MWWLNAQRSNWDQKCAKIETLIIKLDFYLIFLAHFCPKFDRCADGGSVVVCSSCSSSTAILLLFLQHSNFNQGYERLCGKLHKRKPNLKIFTISNCCWTTYQYHQSSLKCNRVTPWQISDTALSRFFWYQNFLSDTVWYSKIKC